jgi:sortase (surface protein transpeptidase)
MTVRVRVKTRTGLSGLVVLACLLAAIGVAGVFAWLKIGAGRELATASAHETQPVSAIRTAPVMSAKPRLPRPPIGSVLGRFEVPALKMSWTVLEGTDDKTLDRSIGHVTGTALPGEPGNIGLAGHRNTHFRKMERSATG